MSDAKKMRELELQSILIEASACAGLPLPELIDMLAPLPTLQDLDFPELLDAAPNKASTQPQRVEQAMRIDHARRSVKISLRIDAQTLHAFKVRAAKRGKRYQRLIKESLRDTCKSWSEASPPADNVDISV